MKLFMPTKVYSEKNCVENHSRELAALGTKALVVTGKHSSRINGSLEDVTKALERENIPYMVYDEIEENPSVETVMKAASLGITEGTDFVIGVGGGSPMDASKAIALMIANPEHDERLLYTRTQVSPDGPVYPALPVAEIPTTAGTGSETDGCGVITKEDTNEKAFIMHPALFPYLAVVDAELMLSVPPLFTAFQGFDALFHSVEGFIAASANLASDMNAREAIRNIAEYLPRAVKDGSDLEARTRVAFANTLSGVVMTLTLLTSEHGLEHALSAYHPNLPHGAGLIMISKAYFSYFVNRHACDDRFVELARLLGMSEANKPEDFIAALVRLQEACGVADLKMSDYGIIPDEFEKFMHNTREVMGIMFTADRVQMSDEDIVRIFAESYR